MVPTNDHPDVQIPGFVPAVALGIDPSKHVKLSGQNSVAVCPVSSSSNSSIPGVVPTLLPHSLSSPPVNTQNRSTNRIVVAAGTFYNVLNIHGWKYFTEFFIVGEKEMVLQFTQLHCTDEQMPS